MDRALRSTATRQYVTFYKDGVAANTDGDVAPLVTAYRDDGSVLFGPVAATNEAAAGEYSTVIEPQTQLDLLRLTWTGTMDGRSVTIETYVEVVGGFYFTLGELNVGDVAKKNLQPWQLAAVRLGVEDLFERATNKAWVPRYARDTLTGLGATEPLYLGRYPVLTVRDISLDGVVVGDAGITRSGKLVRSAGWTLDKPVVVRYEHGERFPPGDLKEAALQYARYLALRGLSRIPDRAMSITTDAGTFQLSIAAKDRPTGLPEVDSVLVDRRRNAGVVFA